MTNVSTYFPFYTDEWGQERTGADVVAWIGMKLDNAAITRIKERLICGWGVDIWSEEPTDNYSSVYVQTVYSLDILWYATLEDNLGNLQGSFEKQKIPARQRNRSRQPIQFWRQKTRHRLVRRKRKERAQFRAYLVQIAKTTQMCDICRM